MFRNLLVMIDSRSIARSMRPKHWQLLNKQKVKSLNVHCLLKWCDLSCNLQGTACLSFATHVFTILRKALQSFIFLFLTCLPMHYNSAKRHILQYGHFVRLYKLPNQKVIFKTLLLPVSENHNFLKINSRLSTQILYTTH